MSTTDVRHAIAESLDFPIAEEAFALIDVIQANILDGGEPGVEGELHEASAEITDVILSTMSTRSLATLWAILGADGAGHDFYGVGEETTRERILWDMYGTIEPAVHAGLATYAEEEA